MEYQSDYKKQIFKKFIYLKYAFQQIHHKKIVHFILQKYSYHSFACNFDSFHNLLEDIKLQLQKSFLSIPGKQIETLKSKQDLLEYSKHASNEHLNSFLKNLKDFNIQINEYFVSLPKLHSLTIQISKYNFKIVLILIQQSLKFSNIKSLNLDLNLSQLIPPKIAKNDIFKTLPKLFSSSLQKLNLNLSQNKMQFYHILKILSQQEQQQEQDIDTPYSLKELTLDLSYNFIGLSRLNQLKFSEFLTKFQLLHSLTLNLNFTRISEDFGTMFSFLPTLKHLQSFKLSLQGNRIGYFKPFLNFLQKIQNIPLLTNLNLDLSSNSLSQNQKISEILAQFLSNLPQITYLNLNLEDNNLGNDVENVQTIFQNLPHLLSLKTLILNLNKNNLGNCQKIYQYLSEGLKKLTNLEHLELSLQENNFSKSHFQALKQQMVILYEPFKNMTELSFLSLSLDDNNTFQSLEPISRKTSIQSN